MTEREVWLPYCGAAPVPGELLERWNFDPVLLVILAAGIWFYVRSNISPNRRAYFAGAMLLSLILFVSPFCALSSALFSARVAHHVLLSAVVAPLLVIAIPPGIARLPSGIGAWTALQAGIFWAWHAPPVYAWALSSDAGYWLMQISLIGAAYGFWAAVRSATAPSAVLGLLGTMIQMGLLGALITFSPSTLYAPHILTTQAWGLSALEDQQLAGIIMWAPSAGLYLGAALFLLGRWLLKQREHAPT